MKLFFVDWIISGVNEQSILLLKPILFKTTLIWIKKIVTIYHDVLEQDRISLSNKIIVICLLYSKLTILLFISWKWISQTLSTTSSHWNVTNPKPGTENQTQFIVNV